MEKYLIWYLLQLKAWIHRKVYWIEPIGMVLLIFLIHNISLPQNDNVQVGVYNAGGDLYAQRVIESLQQKQAAGTSTYEEYDDLESLREDVIAGKLECGFTFEEGFEKKWKNGDIRDTVSYICTPITTKGYVIQETVFAAIYQQYSEQIVENAMESIYVEKDAELLQELLEKNREYLKGNEIFHLQIEQVEQKIDVQTEKAEVFPMQGLIGVVIFMTMLMNSGIHTGTGRYFAARAMEQRHRNAFCYLDNVASVSLEMIAGLGIIGYYGSTRGMLREVFAMLVLVLWSALWILFFGKLQKSDMGFAGMTVSIFVVNLIICPVFVNLYAYVPALKILSYCFPLGIYLAI